MNPKQGVDKKVIDRLNSIPGLNYGAFDEKHLDAIAVLSLPKHLIKTALAILKAIKADSTMVSKITGQEEEIEEANLEELVSLGYLIKQTTELEIFYELK